MAEVTSVFPVGLVMGLNLFFMLFYFRLADRLVHKTFYHQTLSTLQLLQYPPNGLRLFSLTNKLTRGDRISTFKINHGLLEFPKETIVAPLTN